MKQNVIRTAAIMLLAACTDMATAQALKMNASVDQLKINQIQVLGTHNSYAQPVDTTLLAYADPIFDKMITGMGKSMPADQLANFKEFHPNSMKMSEALKYNHPPFDVQLNGGIRSLELDVYYDPTGNRFNHPAGYRTLNEQGITKLASYKTEGLDKPGFKVMHIADFDFRTHYVTLKDALMALKDWSNKHPEHLPIYIMVEAKDKGMPIFPKSAEVLPFGDAAFNDLDAEVRETLGRDKLITPDDVRGKYGTLKEAVLSGNWPTVKAARGKFIFLLLPATAGMDLKSAYVNGRPNLEGRMMFVQSTPEDSYAAFFLLDNAIVRQKEIREFVKQGYIVRTRADIETYEAKVNNYLRAEAAFSSGAQVISTDFFRKGNTYGTGYYVKIPGGGDVRPNPVNSN
mgnify:CR=1 FL=1